MGNKGKRTGLEIALIFSTGKMMLPAIDNERKPGIKKCSGFFKQRQIFIIFALSAGG